MAAGTRLARARRLERRIAPTNATAIAPTTTGEENLHTASQRRVNMIWEYSQAGIALSIVLANIFYVFLPVLGAAAGTAVGPERSRILESAFFLVIGFYFGRTNHARIGDPGTRLGSGGAPLDDRT